MPQPWPLHKALNLCFCCTPDVGNCDDGVFKGARCQNLLLHDIHTILFSPIDFTPPSPHFGLYAMTTRCLTRGKIRVPEVFTCIIVATLACYFCPHLDIESVGLLPLGFPTPALPWINSTICSELNLMPNCNYWRVAARALIPSLEIAVVGFALAMAIIKTFSSDSLTVPRHSHLTESTHLMESTSNSFDSTLQSFDSPSQPPQATTSVLRTPLVTSSFHINPKQELFAIGMSSLASSVVCGSFVVTGSLCRTALAAGVGGRTQLSNLITSFLLLVIVLFLIAPLQFIPLATLAAVELFALRKILSQMSDIASIVHEYRRSRCSLFVPLIWCITFSGVLILGIKWGLCAGMALSILAHAQSRFTPILQPLYSDYAAGAGEEGLGEVTVGNFDLYFKALSFSSDPFERNPHAAAMHNDHHAYQLNCHWIFCTRPVWKSVLLNGIRHSDAPVWIDLRCGGIKFNWFVGMWDGSCLQPTFSSFDSNSPPH